MKKRYELVRLDGEKHYGLCWEVSNAHANIIIMEGMEEHSSRYDDFATYLNEKGFNVYCLDTFGQGENVLPDLSNLGKWPTNGFSIQVDIVDELVTTLEKTNLPTYIFAHSMGSFMAQLYIQKYPSQVSKVVLCGAGSKNPAVKIGLLLAKLINTKRNENKKAKLLNKLMFGSFNKKITHPRTAYDWLSYNELNVDNYIKDPKCGFGPNNKFCLEFLKGMDGLFSKKNILNVNKKINLFIISGEEDPVTNYGKSVNALYTMYSEAGVINVSSKVYSYMRHEILNENNRYLVYEDIASFFDKCSCSSAG